MNYEESMLWLDSRDFIGMKFGLERINHLMKELGDPHKKLKIIHVAGTNGKGSTANMIGSILKNAGYSVGVYTSPHLVDFRERISINGSIIPEEAIAQALTRVRPIAEGMENNRETGKPTYFEISTAAALNHFYDKGVDFAVVEVGLGGRLDATNIVEPIACIITNISLEHKDYLGEDISSIAKEKAAIIKNGCSVVTAAEGDALDVIRNRCERFGCGLSVIGEDVITERIKSDIDGSIFKLNDGGSYEMDLKVAGEHQIRNAACAVACAEALTRSCVDIPENAIIEGIRNTMLEGRFEVVHKSPWVILDGAHNPAGMKSLREALSVVFPGRKVTLVTAICSDKDIPAMLKEIAPVAGRIIVTKHSMKSRTADHRMLSREARKYSANVISKMSVKEALNYAMSSSEKDDIIVVSGSLYLVGDAKKLL